MRAEQVWDCIWETAGILGMDPGPYTLRELMAMAIARQTAEWSRAASLIAVVANCAPRRKGSAAFKPADFMPKAFRAPVDRDDGYVGQGPITILRDVFIDGIWPKVPSGFGD